MGKPQQQPQPLARDGHVVHSPLGVLSAAHGVDAGRSRIQLRDVAGRQARLRQRVDTLEDGRRFVRERLAIDRQRKVGVRDAHRERQIEPRLHEALGRRVQGQLRGRHPSRTLPQDLDGPSQRGFQLLRAHRKQQRQHRIRHHPGIDQIGAREAQLADADLKGGVVPQRDRDRFFTRQAIVDPYPGWQARRLGAEAHVAPVPARMPSATSVSTGRPAVAHETAATEESMDRKTAGARMPRIVSTGR